MSPKNRPQPPRSKDRPKKGGVLEIEDAPLSDAATPRAQGQRHASGPAIVEEHREDAPRGWTEVQDNLAASTGLSLLLVSGHQPPALVASNNNSICHAFQSSLEYVGLCDPYCGDAHRRALSAGSAVTYKCHAGLQCFAMPVQIGRKQNLAAIGGRAFVSAADYRNLVDRFRAGELNDLLSSEPFENVIFAEPERLDQLSQRLQTAARNHNARSSQEQEINTINRPPAGNAKAASDARRSSAELTAYDSLPDLQEELGRLQVELEHRSQLAESLQHFLERISSRDPAKTYSAILTHSRELLKAERASLWVFDESSNEISLKAAAGFATAVAEESRKRMGEGISGKVLESGKPLVVENLELAGLTPAAAERKYRTKSFISYPLTMQGRKIGVLNVADKTSGEKFDDVDLSLLEIISPQIAVAVERADWQERATQFQLMSITDPLTGLLNRRYLEERLTDELNRSQRYNYSMSCLMIDIDDFKNYNDRNGHQAGDVALKITAHALKAALRSADVACRYGGEEFCIVLPQTSLSEAGVIAERMRQRVAEKVYPHGKSQPLGTVSVSIGISTFAKNVDTAEKVIAAADRALYNAKLKGKNRIEFYLES
ncbi:MAG TPA: diguanylate cyclase [Pyrinomonadaceae bacterium]|jgi:diguanylate cyclase (GGDEF)-like protein|nr:diguanylate cyclase [Pyrinomonadaceae bacterium]